VNATHACAAIERAADLIDESDALIIAAGAGMGVDSGLPDFRGEKGFWQAYPALERAKIDFYSIANPMSFRQTPHLAWGFYGHRLLLYRRTVPHPGFTHLKRWGEAKLHGYSVFTSNVDGQFQRAGFDPLCINECHGSLHHLQCIEPCCEAIWSADELVPDVDESASLLRSALPRCPSCGGIARPNVLMFGDWEWIDARQREQSARLEDWLVRVSRPVVIELGAGKAIPSVRLFSERVISEFGGRLVRINPREADVPSRQDVGLEMGALDGLKAVAAVLGER
jgi:NAD-dependent SIR2 family protein deacetylase